MRDGVRKRVDGIAGVAYAPCSDSEIPVASGTTSILYLNTTIELIQ